MNLTPIFILPISVFAALASGLIIFLWQDSAFQKIANYYKQEKNACDSVLTKTHLELPTFIASLIYVAGPILVSLITLLLIPIVTGKVISLFFGLLFFKRLGRRIAKYLYKRYIQKIKDQLINAVGLITNALKSGLSLLQSFEMAADEMPGAISIELKHILSEIKLGTSFENTLKNFRDRIPLAEVKTLVDSILILRETGGNLVETFEILSHTLREEDRVRNKIKTLTTQGIAQAVVIICLPFGLAAALNTLAPGYMDPLFEHWIGWILLAVMIFLQALGAYIMKKIVTIKV